MSKISELELTWIGEENRRGLQPRILIELSENSYVDRNAEKLLIRGKDVVALTGPEANSGGRDKVVQDA